MDLATTTRARAVLTRTMAELADLGGAVGLLGWDQETHMPPLGGDARAEQLATLQGVAHERLTAPALGDALRVLDEDAGLSEVERAMVRTVRRDHDRAVRLPGELVRALAEAQSRSVEVWKAARPARDFALLAPHLEALVRLRREMADAWGVPPGGERYDALLEVHEPGMRVARLAPLFARLASWLSPLVEELAARPAPDDAFLRAPWDDEAQWRFSLELLDAVGFDRRAGRLDRSTHPFTMGIERGDVRLTTRIVPGLPLSSIFSTLHEAGHGLYEQGLPAAWRRTSLGAAASMGLHESQSRLWENLVGRSAPFWQAFLPRLRAHFPAALDGVSVERFVATANRVERSPIRVEADEVTYNLHILLRFELELGLLRDEIPVAELPAAWNERTRALLGISPAHDGEGVLQDIHWPSGEFGYFPTYTLGNLYAASLFEAARAQLGGLDDAIRVGQLLPLRDWLRAHVHAAGRRYDAEDIVRRATGAGLDDAAFERYLRGKYDAPRRPAS